VKNVKPQYTEKARAAGIQGVVELSVVVGMDGNVSDVSVTQPLDDELDQQAVEAMRQWTFKPGTKDGKPVAVRVDVQMTFTLK
jgi:TonB family protein